MDNHRSVPPHEWIAARHVRYIRSGPIHADLRDVAPDAPRAGVGGAPWHVVRAILREERVIPVACQPVPIAVRPGTRVCVRRAGEACRGIDAEDLGTCDLESGLRRTP